MTCHHPPSSTAESGYLLAATSIVLLVVMGLLSSLAFQERRDANYQTFYVMGQRFAHDTHDAHVRVQTAFYEPSGGDPPLNDIHLVPVVVSSWNTLNFQFETRIIPVKDELPALGHGTPSQNVASALVVLHPTSNNPNTVWSATNMAAFIDGAHQKGLTQLGIVRDTTDIESCQADASTAVKWGDDPLQCIGQATLAGINPSIIPGDIVAASWEMALAKMDSQILSRFPQPDRLSFLPAKPNQMQSNLDMNGHDLTARKLTTSNLQGTFLTATTALTQNAGGQSNLATLTAPINNLTVDGAIANTITVNSIHGTQFVFASCDPRNNACP